MVDTCTEPTRTGVPACSLQPTSGGECCSKAMALSGVYTVTDTSLGNPSERKGRQVEWYRYLHVPGSAGTIRVDSTLVPAPYVFRANGQLQVAESEHKLWAAAGENRPLYPDCPWLGNWGDATCNCPTHPDFPPGGICESYPTRYVQKRGVDRRSALASAVSALLTTNGHYTLDIRWNDQADQAPFDYDSFYDIRPIEAVWHATYFDHGWGSVLPARRYDASQKRFWQTPWPVIYDHPTPPGDPNYKLLAHPVCYMTASPARAMQLVDGLPYSNCEKIENQEALSYGWTPIQTRFGSWFGHIDPGGGVLSSDP
jgi:hypothetical protein